jgi:hypothetical protein
VVVEALDADGDAVDAGVDTGLGFVGVEVADAAFEGDFAVVGERQVALAGGDEADEVGGGECGRGAAAEVYGVDLAAALTRFVFVGEFVDEAVGVARAAFFAPVVAVEAAEEAMGDAEGDV